MTLYFSGLSPKLRETMKGVGFGEIFKYRLMKNTKTSKLELEENAKALKYAREGYRHLFYDSDIEKEGSTKGLIGSIVSEKIACLNLRPKLGFKQFLWWCLAREQAYKPMTMTEDAQGMWQCFLEDEMEINTLLKSAGIPEGLEALHEALVKITKNHQLNKNLGGLCEAYTHFYPLAGLSLREMVRIHEQHLPSLQNRLLALLTLLTGILRSGGKGAGNDLLLKKEIKEQVTEYQKRIKTRLDALNEFQLALLHGMWYRVYASAYVKVSQIGKFYDDALYAFGVQFAEKLDGSAKKNLLKKLSKYEKGGFRTTSIDDKRDAENILSDLIGKGFVSGVKLVIGKESELANKICTVVQADFKARSRQFVKKLQVPKALDPINIQKTVRAEFGTESKLSLVIVGGGAGSLFLLGFGILGMAGVVCSIGGGGLMIRSKCPELIRSWVRPETKDHLFECEIFRGDLALAERALYQTSHFLAFRVGRAIGDMAHFDFAQTTKWAQNTKEYLSELEKMLNKRITEKAGLHTSKGLNVLIKMKDWLAEQKGFLDKGMGSLAREIVHQVKSGLFYSTVRDNFDKDCIPYIREQVARIRTFLDVWGGTECLHEFDDSINVVKKVREALEQDKFFQKNENFVCRVRKGTVSLYRLWAEAFVLEWSAREACVNLLDSLSQMGEAKNIDDIKLTKYLDQMGIKGKYEQGSWKSLVNEFWEAVSARETAAPLSMCDGSAALPTGEMDVLKKHPTYLPSNVDPKDPNQKVPLAARKEIGCSDDLTPRSTPKNMKLKRKCS